MIESTRRFRPFLHQIFWVVCGCLLAPSAALAAADGEWRPTYDLVMRWLNFFILVFVIVRYSRRPLVNFLKGRQKEIGDEIRRIEKKKDNLSQATAAARRGLEESAGRLEQIKARIIQQGEKKKLGIIADAHEEGRHILDSARRKVEGTLLQAQNKIREEMIDTAVSIALEKIPEEITAQDNEKLLQQFLTSANGE